MISRSAVLIFPPLVEILYSLIYPSLPVLASVLRKHGYGAKQLEMNSAFVDWYLGSEEFSRTIRRAKRRHDILDGRRALNSDEYEEYVRAEQLKMYAEMWKSGFGDPVVYTGYIFELMGLNLADSVDGPVRKTDIVKMMLGNSSTIRLIRAFYKHYFASRKWKRPMFVGVSVAMLTQLVPALILSNWIKRSVWKGIKLFWGGPLVNLMGEDMYRTIFKYGLVDGIVEGEGEDAIISIANAIRRKDGSLKSVPNLVYLDGLRVVKSEIRSKGHINEYPPPLYDQRELNKRPYSSMLSVVITRGCMWSKCAFCTEPILYKCKQVKEAERVVDDIDCLITRNPGHNILMSCDMMGPSYMRKLCKIIKKRHLEFNWTTFMKVDDGYSLDDLKLMKGAGCYFASVGIESLDAKILKIINKGNTPDQAMRFLNRLFKSGMDVQINMIIDLPGTTYKSALGQYAVLEELMEEAASRGVFSVVANRELQVEKNAPLGISPQKYGIKLKLAKNRKTSDYICHLPYLDCNGMSEDEKRHINDLYGKLNARISMLTSGGLAGGKGVRSSSMLDCQRRIVYMQDHLFEPIEEDGVHKKAQFALAHIGNLQNGLHMLIPNAQIAHWISQKLPARFSDLKRAFKENMTLYQGADDSDLVEIINRMASIGMLYASR